MCTHVYMYVSSKGHCRASKNKEQNIRILKFFTHLTFLSINAIIIQIRN